MFFPTVSSLHWFESGVAFPPNHDQQTLAPPPSSEFDKGSDMPPPPPSPTPPSPPPHTTLLPPPPAALPEELIEEILLRLPPGEPESLFRAALVCKPWCRLISGPRFRRRFREHHRTPPMLGFFCNSGMVGARFVPTTAFSPLGAKRFDWNPLDARHGRILSRRCVLEQEKDTLVVWDPITNEQRELPFPPLEIIGWTAAVLCAGAGAGACQHLDCHRGPFLVVFVGFDPVETFVCTYSSDVGAWSEPISTHVPNDNGFVDEKKKAVLVGNALYFGILFTNITLKYNFESREVSWIELPLSDECAIFYWRRYVLTSTVEGMLGLVTLADSKLCLWSRNGAPEVDAGWTQSRVIDLKTLHPPLDVAFSLLHLVGLTDGLGILFMTVESVLYSIDLKTCKVELYQHRGTKNIVLYMSFYTPELEAACTGEQPSAGGSSA